jgi:hypothetical protein
MGINGMLFTKVFEIFEIMVITSQKMVRACYV